MSLSFFSIDDFYDDPEKVRNHALNSEYNEDGIDILMNVFANGNWPGQTSIDVYRYPKIDSIVSKALGFPLRQVYNSGKFRISYEGSTPKSPLHIDGTNNNTFAGVLYLNKTVNIPGTILYRHKETGRIFGDKDSYQKIFDSGDMTDINKWDIDLLSYIRYNRLIVYSANRYHGPGPSFGNKKENARLVQLFLWQVVE